jgi:hypothetical protein
LSDLNPRIVQLFNDIYKVPAEYAYPLLIEVLSKKDDAYGYTKSTVKGKEYFSPERFASELAALVNAANNTGRHLYMRPVFRDSTEEHALVGSNVLWCDIDKKGNPDALSIIQAFSPAPSYVVFSGGASGGWHLIWLLTSFCTDLTLLQSKLYGIANALRGDFSAAGVAKGIRFPGTVNWKYYKPDLAPENYAVTLSDWSNPTPRNIHDFPDGSKPKKEKVSDAPALFASYRELFGKYFPDFPEPQKDWWTVLCPFHPDTMPSFSINVVSGYYTCLSSRCAAKGTAVDFYRRIENISWKRAEKLLENLKSKNSLIDLLEAHLRELCTPLYRDATYIALVQRRRDGSQGRHILFNTGSRTSVRSTLSLLFDGSPAQTIQEAIGDNVPLQTLNIFLEEAALQLGQDLPYKEDIALLGQGFHYEGDYVFRLNGRDFERYEKGVWIPIHDTIYDNRYSAFHNVEDPQAWYPVIQVTKTPENRVLLGALIALLTSWRYALVDDGTMIALYTLYAPHWHLFGTPIHMQISGDSQSGKSSLSEGWFAGRMPGSTQMVPGCQYATNITAAYVYQVFDRWRLPLVLDEVLDHDNRKSKELTELSRTFEGSGTPIRRGTNDGRMAKAYHVNFPAIWSSIKIPDTVQDTNRRLHIQLPRIDNPPLPNPWQFINMRWTKDALEQIAAAGVQVVLRNVPALRRECVALSKELEDIPGASYRMASRLIPLLAIARICDMNTDDLLLGMMERVRGVEESTQDVSPTEMIRQTLLYRRVREEGIDGETSLHTEINRATGRDLRSPESGIYYWRDRGEVGVIAGRFHQAHYRHDPNTSPVYIGRMLKNLPGYVGSEVRRIDGVTARVAIFKAIGLMGGSSGGSSGGSNGKSNGTTSVEVPVPPPQQTTPP